MHPFPQAETDIKHSVYILTLFQHYILTKKFDMHSNMN